MISLKINLIKIDKSKLFKSEKGNIYLDAVLIETQNNEYGNDYVIIQNISKEERAEGKKGEILGNAKIIKAESQPIQEDELPWEDPFK